jgi:hypothetical protein
MEYAVCYTCGCKLPYADRGDAASIVEEDLKNAGYAETADEAGVQTAKLNLLELIQLQKDDGSLANPRRDYNREPSNSSYAGIPLGRNFTRRRPT